MVAGHWCCRSRCLCLIPQAIAPGLRSLANRLQVFLNVSGGILVPMTSRGPALTPQSTCFQGVMYRYHCASGNAPEPGYAYVDGNRNLNADILHVLGGLFARRHISRSRDQKGVKVGYML